MQETILKIGRQYPSHPVCNLAGRYENPIPTRFLAPIDFLKIPIVSSRGSILFKISLNLQPPL